jgi:N-acetyl-anhydromuramyl-L-alanine amidase AmpD
MARRDDTWVWLLGAAVVASLLFWRRKDVSAIVDTALEALNMNYTQADQTNFKVGRAAGVDTIVIHTTEGSAAAAIGWFAMNHGTSSLGPTSAHYVIDVDGTVTQCVDTADTAYHAGNSSVNARSVGVELAGRSSDPGTFTDPMMYSLVRLCRELQQTYPAIQFVHGLPGILGHSEVPKATHTDPGPYFPWDSFLAQLNQATYVA